MLDMTYKWLHAYAFDTLFGCQVGTVASPKLVRPAVEHQAEGIEKLLRTGIHTSMMHTRRCALSILA